MWETIGVWCLGLFFFFLFFILPVLLVLGENVKYYGHPLGEGMARRQNQKWIEQQMNDAGVAQRQRQQS